MADQVAVDEREQGEDLHAGVRRLRVVGRSAADHRDTPGDVLDERLHERLVPDVAAARGGEDDVVLAVARPVDATAGEEHPVRRGEQRGRPQRS